MEKSHFHPLHLQEPLSTVVIKAEPLVPEPMDFPWINQNYRGQNYQFLYSLGKELLHPNKVQNWQNCTKNLQKLNFDKTENFPPKF